jgi:hypothetical protein
MNSKDWLSVLKLAAAWQLDSARQAALDALRDAEPAIRIVVARRFDVPEWFTPAVNALAQRQAPLGLDDFIQLRALGTDEGAVELMLKVAEVRESMHIRPAVQHTCLTNGKGNCYQHNRHATICSVDRLVWPSRADINFTTCIEKVFGDY